MVDNQQSLRRTLPNLRVSSGLLVGVLMSGTFLASIPTCGIALGEEPAAKFLERLKEEGYYDEGLKYLDISLQRNRLPQAMKGEVDLERILLLQLSLKDVRSEKAVAEKIAAIEKGFKDFLAASKDHPRRGETLLKLADMYLAQGGQYLEEAKLEAKSDAGKTKAEELRLQARASLQLGFDTFGETITYLRPVLEGMQGANVKPNETERLALREKLQTEYRQGQILQAITSKFLAETYEPESAEWKKRLEDADTRLADVADKSSKQAGAKYLSLLNRGHVQALLRQIDAARESYNRVAENEEPGVFRTWRVQAVAGIVRLDSSPASGKYEAAVLRGEEQLKMADSRERDKPEWLDLQMAVAEARLAWLKTIDEKNDEGKYRNIRREARESLQNLAKRPGTLQRKATELLKDLGIETKVNEDTKLPEVKTFEEAVRAAQGRFNRAESGDATLQILDRQLQQAAVEDKPGIEEQIGIVTEDANRDRQQAIELHQTAFTLYRDGDSRDDLLQARFLQSYLYLKLGAFREAIAIADVILRTNRGSDMVLKAGAIELQAFAQLIDGTPSEKQAEWIPVFKGFVTRLVEVAPGTPESNQAVDVLASLAMREKQWDQAEEYFQLKPNFGGPKEFLLGRVRWAQYRQNMYAHRQDGTAETPEDTDLLQRAEKLMSRSYEVLEASNIDAKSLEGTNDLIGLYLQTGRLDDATRILNESGKGSIAQSENIADIDAKIQLETQRMRLQSLVQLAGQGRLQLAADEVAKSIAAMKSLSDQTGDPNMLTRSLQSLAADLQNQLETNKDPAQQAKLADAFKILVDQLVGLSTDAATLESIGSAMTLLASNLERLPSLAAKVPSLMQSAEAAFEKLRGLPESELQKIQRKPEEVLLKLGMAKRGAGKFKEAHALFIEGLQKSANNITIQIEAARNLLLWSGGTDAELLKQAMLGTERQANKKNLVWGWGQIAQTTSRYPNFQAEFFEARLNVAKCRAQLGDAEPDKDKKKKLYEAAIGDIRTTFVRFPELGGKTSHDEFDRLMREVQQKAGQPATGL